MKLVLSSPRITEKGLRISGLGQYIFTVPADANKHQIAFAVESAFKVNVVRVNTIKYQPTKTRTGRKRLPALTKTYKKAIVTLKKGQTLPIFETKG